MSNNNVYVFTIQARVQDFVRGGGAKSESLFFCFSIFEGGGQLRK